MYHRILFLDFDGTITSEETLEGCMALSIDRELYKQKQQEMMEGKITLAEALHQGFATIPAHKLPLMMDYVRGVPVRPGFKELLLAMKEEGIPVVVISGGLKPCIEEKLEPYRDLIMDVYSVNVEEEGGTLKLISDYEEKGDMMEKTLIMKKYDYEESICAGDSFTDIRMAKASDMVFARDRLAKILEKEGIDYIPWEDFYDIKDKILGK